MQRSLTKYRIGLSLIGLFTVVILVIVLVQASATKQDQQTFNKANDIAIKLNNYIDSSYSGTAPSSLLQAGITDVPSTISYHRMTAYTYYFCAKYKNSSTDFNASSIEQNIIMRGFGGGADNSSDQGSYNNLPDLEINPVHHKGWNCETIQLYNYNSNTPIYNNQ